MRLAGAGRGRLCAPPGGLWSTDPGWIEMPCGCSQQELAAVPPELWALFPAWPGPGAAAALSGTGGCVARVSLRGQGPQAGTAEPAAAGEGGASVSRGAFALSVSLVRTQPAGKGCFMVLSGREQQ